MSGIEMLMKSFGINPEEIKAQVEAARVGALEIVHNFDVQLKAIEASLIRIEQTLAEYKDPVQPAGETEHFYDAVGTNPRLTTGN